MRMNRMLIVLPLLLAAGIPTVSSAQERRPASAIQSPAADNLFALRGMIGKRVLGKSREFLGTLAAVDGEKKTADMKIPTGAMITLSADKLSVEDDHVRAASISRGDVLAMVRETGQQGTLEAGVLSNPFKQ